MLPVDKHALLSGFLGQLPAHVTARLAKAVEVDRLIGGTELPHDELLSALRPQLREMERRPARLATPQRYFCRPFEDLLVNAMPKTKQKGRIARASLQPVWHWLASDLIPERHQELTEAIAGAIVKQDEEKLHANLEELWREAAAAIREALATPEKKKLAARLLGSHVIAEDAAEMALLIGAGTEILVLQSKLPRPIPTLGAAEIETLREVHDQFLVSRPDIGPYLAVIAMARLERPWEALHLTARLARQSTDTVISSTDMGLVGEILFNDLEHYVEKIRTVRPGEFDPTQLLAALSAFAELSSGMVKELGIRRDGKWGQRLTKARSTVAQIIEGLLERAPREILGALPAARAGSFGKGPKPLDLHRPPDPEKFARAMRYAHLVAHSRPFAVAAAFNAKLLSVTDEITTAVRTFGEDLLREVRAAREGSHAEHYIDPTLDLCALVLGEEEAALLRRRARVPAGA